MSAQLVQVGPSPADVLLRMPRNWPVAATAAAISLLHFSIAIIHVERGGWTTGVAAALGVIFALIAVAMLFTVRELEINVSHRCVRVRRGLGRLESVRYIPFTQVQAVRLTQYDQYGHHHSRIDLILPVGMLRCPTTDAPRQQALLMAMAINARLIKIWQSTTPVAPRERMQQMFGSDDDRAA